MRLGINEEREGGWQCRRARCQQNLPLKKDRTVWKCALSLPEERGTVLLEVCEAVPSRALETWWDNPWIWTGRSMAFCRAVPHLPVFRACWRFTCSPTACGRLFFPFPFPTGVAAEESAQALQTFQCFITGTRGRKHLTGKTQSFKQWPS